MLAACDPEGLQDSSNATLAETSQCDMPYSSLAIKDGIVCYSETAVGSVALYYCLNCGFSSIQGSLYRTCQSDGTWSGSVPSCNCKRINIIMNMHVHADDSLMSAVKK